MSLRLFLTLAFTAATMGSASAQSSSAPPLNPSAKVAVSERDQLEELEYLIIHYVDEQYRQNMGYSTREIFKKIYALRKPESYTAVGAILRNQWERNPERAWNLVFNLQTGWESKYGYQLQMVASDLRSSVENITFYGDLLAPLSAFAFSRAAIGLGALRVTGIANSARYASYLTAFKTLFPLTLAAGPFAAAAGETHRTNAQLDELYQQLPPSPAHFIDFPLRYSKVEEHMDAATREMSSYAVGSIAAITASGLIRFLQVANKTSGVAAGLSLRMGRAAKHMLIIAAIYYGTKLVTGELNDYFTVEKVDQRFQLSFKLAEKPPAPANLPFYLDQFALGGMELMKFYLSPLDETVEKEFAAIDDRAQQMGIELTLDADTQADNEQGRQKVSDAHKELARLTERAQKAAIEARRQLVTGGNPLAERSRCQEDYERYIIVRYARHQFISAAAGNTKPLSDFLREFLFVTPKIGEQLVAEFYQKTPVAQTLRQSFAESREGRYLLSQHLQTQEKQMRQKINSDFLLGRNQGYMSCQNPYLLGLQMQLYFESRPEPYAQRIAERLSQPSFRLMGVF